MFHISTVRTIIRKSEEDKWKPLKSRPGLEWPRKISDRMAWDLVKNAQERQPHITAKEQQEMVSKTQV